jgi:hypothetical protein
VSRYDDWVNDAGGTLDDYVVVLRRQEGDRRNTVWKIQHDLAFAAADLGQTGTQIESKMDELFSTFGEEWAIYVIAGAIVIIDAITNDTTLPWLDTIYPSGSGITFRTRIINRLS